MRRTLSNLISTKLGHATTYADDDVGARVRPAVQGDRGAVAAGVGGGGGESLTRRSGDADECRRDRYFAAVGRSSTMVMAPAITGMVAEPIGRTSPEPTIALAVTVTAPGGTLSAANTPLLDVAF